MNEATTTYEDDEVTPVELYNSAEDEDDEGEETPKPKKVNRAGIKKRLREENENNLVEYIRSLTSGGVQVRTIVMRDQPRVWEDKNIAGQLETFEDPISIEDIRDLYGGGKYRLQFFIPAENGSWQYVTCRTFQLAGDPKVRSSSKPSDTKEDPTIVQSVLQMTQRMSEKERERAERIEREARSFRDPSVDIMAEELREARRQANENQRVIYDLMNQQGRSSPADHLLGKMMDSESARIAQLRAQHDSELRMKNEMHRDELERVHARHDQTMKWQEDSHRREIESLRLSLSTQEKLLETSYRGQLRALERELEVVRTDYMAAKAEIAELRAKKDKGLVESLTELSTVKEQIDSVFGGGEKEDSGGTIERLINGAMPLVEGMATRIAGGAAIGAVPQQPIPQQQAVDPNDLPINQPVPLPDGRLAVRRADGRVVVLRPKRPAAPGTPPALKLDPTEIQVAVQVMENAVANDMDPAVFATSARNVVPPDIIQALRSQGVDQFLANVAKLESHSPLLTLHGKEWSRKVAAILTSD